MTGRAPAARRERRALRSGLAAGVSAGFMAFAPVASAHAPPLGARVLAGPSGEDEVIVTNRGLVFHDPSTGESSLLCNEALRITTAEIPHVALLGEALLVATSSGLRISRDRGCTWQDVGGMQTTNTPALASAPDDPSTVYVASYAADRAGLLVTRDGGKTWTLAVETDAADYVHSLLVAGEGASHVYATLTVYAAAAPPAHQLLRSLDGGKSWQRRPLPLGDVDYAAQLAAADPRDPEALVLYTIANSPGLDSSRLLVSTDGGDSFTLALERPEIRDANHDAEGQLWVAARDGLYRARSNGAAFERVSDASELGCVGAHAGGGVLVCGHYAGVEVARSGVGVSRDGQRFESLLDFDHVRAPVVCDPGTPTAALCAQPWRDWQVEMLGGAPGAASGPNAATGSALPSPSGAIPSAPASDAGAATSDDELAASPTPSCAVNEDAMRQTSSSRRTSTGGAVAALTLAAALRRALGRRRTRRPASALEGADRVRT